MAVHQLLKQLPIDEAGKEALVQVRTNIFFDTSNELAEQLYTGEISIGEWQETMKTELRQLHSSLAAIGKGGWDKMGPRDWGRLGPAMRKEYEWLARFANHISTNRNDLSLKYIQNRARLYGHGAQASTVRSQAGFYLGDLLPWLPKDGSTECLNKCKCHWSLNVVDTHGVWQIVECTWRLGAAEHCPTCVSRDGYTETFRIPPDVAIPDSIGGF